MYWTACQKQSNIICICYLFDMTPEQLIGGRFCLPEREVRNWSPIQWEESLLQKKTKDTEVGVIDEIKIETRPKLEVRDMSGQQLHIYGEILPHDGRKFPQFSRVAEMEKIYLIPKKISSF